MLPLVTVASPLYIFYLPGKLFLGPEKDARLLSARTQRCGLRKSARPELRIQRRQSSRRRLPVAESFPAGRSRHAAGRNRAPGSQSRIRRHEKRDHERNSNTLVILSGAEMREAQLPAQSKDPVRSHAIRFRGLCTNQIFCPFARSSFSVLPSSPAQTLTGTVKNATTGKPAAGDEVILLSLGQGMEEAGRTKADAKGNFSFKLDNAQGPHLVRVIHQEVTYHRMAPPGTHIRRSRSLRCQQEGRRHRGRRRHHALPGRARDNCRSSARSPCRTTPSLRARR